MISFSFFCFYTNLFILQCYYIHSIQDQSLTDLGRFAICKPNSYYYFFCFRQALEMLQTQIQERNQKLEAAGKIHTFNRDIEDSMSRIQV